MVVVEAGKVNSGASFTGGNGNRKALDGRVDVRCIVATSVRDRDGDNQVLSGETVDVRGRRIGQRAGGQIQLRSLRECGCIDSELNGQVLNGFIQRRGRTATNSGYKPGQCHQANIFSRCCAGWESELRRVVDLRRHDGKGPRSRGIDIGRRARASQTGIDGDDFDQRRRERRSAVNIGRQAILQLAKRIDGRLRGEQGWVDRANLERNRLILASCAFVDGDHRTGTYTANEVINRHIARVFCGRRRRRHCVLRWIVRWRDADREALDGRVDVGSIVAARVGDRHGDNQALSGEAVDMSCRRIGQRASGQIQLRSLREGRCIEAELNGQVLNGFIQSRRRTTTNSGYKAVERYQTNIFTGSRGGRQRKLRSIVDFRRHDGKRLRSRSVDVRRRARTSQAVYRQRSLQPRLRGTVVVLLTSGAMRLLQLACPINGRLGSEQQWVDRAHLERNDLVFTRHAFVDACNRTGTEEGDKVVDRH